MHPAYNPISRCENSAESLILRISLRKRNYLQNHFSVIGPPVLPAELRCINGHTGPDFAVIELLKFYMNISLFENNIHYTVAHEYGVQEDYILEK